MIPQYSKCLPMRQLLSIAARTLWVRICHRSDSVRAGFLLWRFGASVGPGLSVSGRLRCFSKGNIVIGREVRINSGPDQNYVGGDRRTNFWVAPGARLQIEDGAAISNSTIVARTSVRIGQGTYIGGGCDIYDNDFHELLPADRAARRGNIGAEPVEIGHRAFIGGHTIILKGVSIGEGSVIGAGSLVTKSVPSFEIWAGRPAKFIKMLPARN